MFILRLLSKSFSGILPRSVGTTSIPHRLVTESVFRPASKLKPYSVFRRHQLPYHLVQRCLHRSANRPGTPHSRWDCPSTLRPADIHATFPTQPTVHQLDIRQEFHHVPLCDSTYKHPNHKSRSPHPHYSTSGSRRGYQQKPSWSRRVCHPHTTSGQSSVRGRRSCTTMPVNLTDSCRWRLYDAFDAHSQLRLNDTYRRYQTLMHRLSIL